MPYEIKLTETSQEDLKRFDKELQKRFFKKIEKLKEYPQIYGKPLRKPLAGKWELRFEDKWRIIYVINEREKQVEIETIWHKDDF